MKYMLPDHIYDAIKLFVTVIMPAISVLYVALAGIWGFPYADEIARTISALYTFFCALMGISKYTAKVDYSDLADEV